jgi:predicted metal-binding membrane protein
MRDSQPQARQRETAVRASRLGLARALVLLWLGTPLALCWGVLLLHLAQRLPIAVPAAIVELLEHRLVRPLPLACALWLAAVGAVMLPAAMPGALAHARVARRRARHPWLRCMVLMWGQVLILAGFALALAFVQTQLLNAHLADDSFAIANGTAGALLLALAGVYQWTATKQASLAHCRSPTAFALAGWRPGAWGALRMAAQDAAAALGCWSPLLALLFVAGVGSVAAVAALSGFVLAERLLPRGTLVACAGGLALVAWATLLLFP